jgi:hypothetical protein
MRSLLVLVAVAVMSLACAQAAPARVGGFESGGFEEFSWWSASDGSLGVTSEQAYEGVRSARASNAGVGNQFQRVWYDVAWGEGSEAWYGMALLVPRLADWCWWSPVRWDNYATHGGAGDVGGVRIEQGRLFVDVGTYAGQHALLGPVGVPEGRWFWLEVHQRFSATSGEALTEVYLDGVKRGVSTAPNTAGRRIDTIRYGNVAMETSCSAASSIYFDRVALTGSQLGPRRADVPAPGTTGGGATAPARGPEGSRPPGEGRRVRRVAAMRCRPIRGAARTSTYRCLIARPPRGLVRAIGRRRAIVTLRRRGRVYATGTARRSRRGVELRMTARRRLRSGRYAASLLIGTTASRWLVTLR